MRPNSPLRSVLLLFLLCMAAMLSAQPRFTVNGRMKVEAGDLSGARVVVYKNGVKERTITQSVGKFTLDLDLQQNYILSFEKDGFVSKKIAFNTKVPADAVANSFVPFDFAVSIFKQYDDVNLVVFNQPVGMIRYEQSEGDFDYDTDYTKSIQSQLQATQAAIEQKQKEEKDKEANAAKAAAKAEADAKKAAEQAARDEQARAAAAQREAQQKEAERLKAEAEAKRAAEKASKPAPPPPTTAERAAKPAP
nr:carboxypeptidase-like regulatory domain-containing protein [Flavobacteriales bacterium]